MSSNTGVLKNRVGETKVANNGLLMTIIAYRNANDLDIEFEDGVKRYNLSYSVFKRGCVKHPDMKRSSKSRRLTSRVGETNIAKNGMLMTIISYESSKKMTIEFEDGTLRHNICYAMFKQGKVKHPTYVSDLRVGERRKNKQGLWMEIIAYRGTLDIDVKFDIGGVVSNTKYESFKKGVILRRKFLDNDIVFNKNGDKVRIIDSSDYSRILIKFEDGKTRFISYSTLSSGSFVHPDSMKKSVNVKNLIGQTWFLNSGDEVKVIGGKRSSSLIVEFKDGTIKNDVALRDLKKGTMLRKFDADSLRSKRLGEIGISTCGLRMEIIDYKTSTSIIVRFEDGYEKKSSYSQFLNRGIRHNTLTTNHREGSLGSFITKKIAYRGTSLDDVNYICECTKCDLKDILTPSEMLEHSCEVSN